MYIYIHISNINPKLLYVIGVIHELSIFHSSIWGHLGRHVGPPSFDARSSVQDMMALDNLSGLAAEDRSTRKVRC